MSPQPTLSRIAEPATRTTSESTARVPALAASTAAVAVLVQERAVLLGAVDPVGAALDLRHRGGARDRGGDRAADERRLARLPPRGARALPQRVGEELADRAGRELLDRRAHHARERLDLEHGGEADDRDERGQDRQRDLEGQRARVAEAVGGAEARDGVGGEPAAADLPQRLERLVALELLLAGDGDRGRGGHQDHPVPRRPGLHSLGERVTLNQMVQYPQIDRTFAALADPTRRGILERLGRGSATISELAEPYGISLTGIKKHVRVLEDAGLVTTEKVGRERHCSAGPRRLEDVREWTDMYRRMLEDRLDRFGQMLERTKGVTP